MASSLPLFLLVLCSLSVAQSQLKLFNLRASNLPSDLLGTTDGYVKVFCGSATLGTTSIRNNNVNPWWEEEFAYFKAQQNDVLRLEVYDSDVIFDDLLGVCQRQIKLGTHEHDCFLEKEPFIRLILLRIQWSAVLEDTASSHTAVLDNTESINTGNQAIGPFRTATSQLGNALVQLKTWTTKLNKDKTSCDAMVSSLLLFLLVLCSLTVAQAQLKLFNLQASNLPSSILGTTDGYVKVFCGSVPLGETSVRNNNPNPWWEEEFTHFKAQKNDILQLEVHDSDFIIDDLLGVCQRQIKLGTHEHDCFLEKGGILHYSYTLGRKSH
ncbi:uncharacterized protein LOC122876745 isoform X2 [Siniperca chuatsi]|nr:uncharacterized protein LOC122876745 isoform X2 [Siniperca chuatsi]